MKPFMKVGALLLAVLMLFTTLFAVGCTPVSLGKEWSYKSGDNELAIGVYIYSLNMAYSQAKGFAEEQLGDKYDSYSTSWLDEEIKDDDDNTQVAREWITEQAKKTCLNLLAVDAQIKELGIDISGATIDSAKKQAESYWNVGPYASQGYVMPLKDNYEPYGVSLESFSYCTMEYNLKYQAVFDKLYNEGGSKYVSDDELSKYFTENYTDYKYISVNLYTSSTDEAGEQTSVAMSESEAKKVTDKFDAYVKDINGGKSFKDVAEAYMKDENLETDPTQSGVDILDKSSLGDELKEAIEKLKTNEASAIKIGDGDSAMYYLIFKDDIKSDVDEYIKQDTNRSSVLANMKSDEYKDFIEDLAKNLQYEVNSSVIGKYSPEMFFIKPDPTTAPAETEAVDSEEE